jgi:uncharacterized DUF497 family protein
MKFEWDDNKNQSNIRKHGIAFEQAATIFDGFIIQRIDDRFDYGEEREISIGMIDAIAIIVVVHTDRDGTCRIISARQADREERKYYEQEIRKAFNA